MLLRPETGTETPRTETPGSRARAVRAVWTPSPARRILRHRLTWLLGLVGLAAVVSMTLTTRMAALEDERTQWGRSELVAVVTEPLQVGDRLAGAVTLKSVPAAVVPASAMTELRPQALAKTPLHPGEIILNERVTDSSTSALPTGMVALTVPIVTRVPLIGDGDLVDLWMIDSANFSSHRVAHRVVVLAITDDEITVAVPEHDAAEAAVASLRPVTVTLLG